MSKLLIVGTIALDAIETPFGSTGKVLGGSATFIGLGASLFEVDSAIVSVVGGDLPSEHLYRLEKKGINLDGVEILPNRKSFFWSGRYHNDLNSRDTLETQLNVLADFEPKVPEAYKDSDIVMLGNLDPAIQLDVLDQLNRPPKLVVLDTMNYWMDNTWDLLMKVLTKTDVLTINDEEARQLTGEYSLVKAAAKIFKMGPRYVIIKKGENGSLSFHEDQIFFAPALPLREVFDPTGAGDTFAGGFVGYLAKYKDISFESMKNAVICGATLASFCVERFGTERIMHLKDKEARDRVEQFKQLTQFEIELS